MVRSGGTSKASAYADEIDFGTHERFEEIVRSEREQMGGGRAGMQVGCSVKSLPQRLSGKAAKLAAHLNPANRTPFEAVDLPPDVMSPMALTILVAKYWGPDQEQFTVSFMEDPPSDLRERIVEHMNAWAERIGKSFVQANGDGLVRITLEGDGYWSYLGTDNALIPRHEPTMSLQGFNMGTSESEYRRVVRHETGHMLGFPHEHMRRELVDRLDRQKTIDYFWQTQGWPENVVEQQVLTPLDEAEILGTPADQDSIMCYQLPGEITKDGRPIKGGVDINPTDYEFAALLYPQAYQAGRSRRGGKAGRAAAGAGRRGRAGQPGMAQDWGEENDVDLSRYGLA